MLGRDTRLARFPQQCQDYLWSLALCQLALLASVAARVDVFQRALQLLLLRRRGQQAVAERQEGIPVTPAEREHAEALHVRAVDVVSMRVAQARRRESCANLLNSTMSRRITSSGRRMHLRRNCAKQMRGRAVSSAST